MNRLVLIVPIAAGALIAAAAGCHSPRQATRDTFTRGMQAYLAKRGDLCVGRRAWPIDVTEHDASVRAPDAVQLPVLERLGLVKSNVVPVREGGLATPFSARRYQLTAAGRDFYLDRETRRPISPDDRDAPARGDLCVAKLGLRQVTRWDVQPAAGAAPATAAVSYTYAADAPAWTRDHGFQKVFPAVARLLAGAGHAELVEVFTLAPDGWTANELLPPAGAPSSPPQAAAP